MLSLQMPRASRRQAHRLKPRRREGHEVVLDASERRLARSVDRYRGTMHLEIPSSGCGLAVLVVRRLRT